MVNSSVAIFFIREVTLLNKIHFATLALSLEFQEI